jgi:hypothetical protein
VLAERRGAHGAVGAEQPARADGHGDPAREPHRDHRRAQPPGRAPGAGQLGGGQHLRAAEVRHPPGRFAVRERDEVRGQIARGHRLERRGRGHRQHPGAGRLRQQRVHELVELRGPHRGGRHPGRLDQRLDGQLLLVVAQRHPVDADDRDVHQVSHARPLRASSSVAAACASRPRVVTQFITVSTPDRAASTPSPVTRSAATPPGPGRRESRRGPPSRAATARPNVPVAPATSTVTGAARLPGALG